MQLAGIDIDAKQLLALSIRLRKAGLSELADWLQIAHDRDIPALALSPFERQSIVDELVGSHDELAEICNQLVHRESRDPATARLGHRA